MLLFAATIVLFQFADASMLPSIGVNLAHSGLAQSSLWMSGLIMAPQIVVSLLVGAMGAVAAAISASATGYLFQTFGSRVGFLTLAVAAAAATGMIWLFITETKPEKYEDRSLVSASIRPI